MDRTGGAVAAADGSRRRWKLLRIGVSGLLLAFLLWHIDLRSSLAGLVRARIDLLLTALALLVFWRYVSAYRWYLLLRGKHPAVTLLGVCRLVLTSTFLGYFLPGMGTDVVRLYGLSRTTADPALVFASLLVERLTASLALMAFVLVGLILVPLPLPSIIGDAAGIGLVGLVLATIVVMHPRTRALSTLLMSRSWLLPLRARFDKVYRCLDAYRDQPWLMAGTLVLGLVVQFLRVVPTAVTAWALGLQVPFVYFLVIVPTIFLLLMLPISIGGLGVREAAYVYLFGLVGIAPEAALGLAIANYLLGVLSVLTGAWVYARRGIQG